MMPDLFDLKNLKPMLIKDNVKPFDDPDWLFELKWDGERCVAYLDPKAGTELRNKRQVQMNSKVPELAGIHKQVKKRCVLDGELMILKYGKPDFYEIQRRSLMSNSFRIELVSKQYPASFIAFDILYLDGEDLTHKPLTERKKLLQKMVKENERIAVSRFIEGQGKALYEVAKAQALEGVVGKRKDSIYTPGKRTNNWKKIKYLLDEDYVIAGYIRKEKHMNSIILAQYNKDGVLQYKGHVTLGVNGKPFQKIKAQPKAIRPPMDFPASHKNEEATWISPTLVCTVEYMQKSDKGGLRQPVFKGIREDKTPEECME